MQAECIMDNFVDVNKTIDLGTEENPKICPLTNQKWLVQEQIIRFIYKLFFFAAW